jgi:hypothetical protein
MQVKADKKQLTLLVDQIVRVDPVIYTGTDILEKVALPFLAGWLVVEVTDNMTVKELKEMTSSPLKVADII